MKKFKFILSVSAFLTANFAVGQQVTFVVERDTLLYSDGSVAGRNALTEETQIDNRDLLNVYGGFVPSGSLSSFVSTAESLGTAIQGNLDVDGALSAFATSLSEISWNSISIGSGLFAGSRDFADTFGGPDFAGSTPFMLITNAASIEEIGIGSELGLVYSSGFVLPELNTFVIGFSNTGDNWDTAPIGTIGSFQMVNVIPEPSAFGLIAGFAILGAVGLRRRARA